MASEMLPIPTEPVMLFGNDTIRLCLCISRIAPNINVPSVKFYKIKSTKSNQTTGSIN